MFIEQAPGLMTTTKFNFITFWIWKVNKFHHSQHLYWAKATLFSSSPKHCSLHAQTCGRLLFFKHERDCRFGIIVHFLHARDFFDGTGRD
jgi:hypothetical protein